MVVDAVYDKLFKFDITKKHFLPKNEGFEGPTDGNGKVADSLEDLTIDNPQIKVSVLFFRTPKGSLRLFGSQQVPQRFLEQVPQPTSLWPL